MEEAEIPADTRKIISNILVRIRQVFDSEIYAYSALQGNHLPSIGIREALHLLGRKIRRV
jgi:hypothetical protein